MARGRRRWRMLAALLGLATAAGHPASRAHAAPVARSGDDLLVLQVRLGDLVLDDDLFAWQTPTDVLLPIRDLSARLDLAITTDLARGEASGFLLEEHRRFNLDIGRREILVDGRRETFDRTLVELHTDDIYVASRLLSRWLPIDFEVDIASLTLRLMPREVLPIQSRLTRERTWSKHRSSVGGRRGPRFRARPEPYALAAWPMVDANVDLFLARRSDGTFGARSRQSLLAHGDLLGFSGELFLSGRGDEARGEALDDVRLTLGRHDPDGRLLGALRATDLRFGDVSPRFDTLISRGGRGRGFEVVRAPETGFDGPDDRAFDHTALRGTALPGWDVELYRNNILHDFLTVDADGVWAFEDIPLDFGLNLLRVVLYGPQGQRREITERVTIGAGLLPPGTVHYRFGAAQEQLGLLRSLGATGRDVRPGTWRLGGDLELGLHRHVTLDAGIASLVLDDGRHSYARAGVRASLVGISTRLLVVADAAGGWAVQLGARRKAGRRASLTLEHLALSGFRSEAIIDGLESSSDLRYSGQLRLPRAPSALRRIPFSLALVHERRSGASRLRVRGTSGFSWPLGRLHLGHRLALEATRRERRLGGALSVNGRLWSTTLRGNLRYELLPKPTLLDFSLTAERDLGPDLQLRAELTQSLRQARTALSAGVHYRLRTAVVGARLAAGSDGHVELGASLAFHLTPLPRAGRRTADGRAGARRLRVGAGAASSQSALLARVFLDHDGDARFGAGDEPLENVGFQVAGRPHGAVTDRSGEAYLVVPVERQVDIELAEGTLEDPYWLPVRQGIGLIARPGSVRTVAFPIAVSAEIDGTVRLRSKGHLTPVANVALELVDAAGEVVAETTSQFDGFFVFQRLRPGTYHLRLGDEQAARLGLAAAERAVVLAAGEVRSGEDLVVERLAPTRSSADGPGRPRTTVDGSI